MPDRKDFATAQEYNKAFANEFRANGGDVTGPLAGRKLLILTTTGAKSGRLHETPLIYINDGDRWIISGANGGAPTHPDWYHNLVQQPRARVELADQSFEVLAREASGPERDRLHLQRLEESPNYPENVTRTTRQIPLMILERIE